MEITVVNKKREDVFKLAADAKVRDLKVAYAKSSKKDINRLSFKQEGGTDASGKASVIRLDDDSKTLASYGIQSGTKVTFKDLGPQIGYRTVFLLEYFGPMVFVGLYALRPALIFGAAAASQPYDWVAKMGIIGWMAHFLKREFETIFIHKFSRPTMPLSNLFKNCAYYWTFGAVIGYPLCSPEYVPPATVEQVYFGLGLFVLSELGNFIIHVMLSNMRPAEGSQKRDIPRGFLFNYVCCPNYTFEVLSWVGFSIMTQIPFAYLFTLVGFLQMAEWAKKKHNGYKKTYEKEYTKLKLKAIIPFIY